jgi:hypothetical protein
VALNANKIPGEPSHNLRTGKVRQGNPAFSLSSTIRRYFRYKIDSVTRGEKELMSAADAMPEDKYCYKPTSGEFKGVRSFGEQLKRIAAVNYILGAATLGEKQPVDVGGESGQVAIKSKAETIKFTNESFAYRH